MVKTQAAEILGLQLTDSDVGNIPMIAADAYGRFIPGPVGRGARRPRPAAAAEAVVLSAAGAGPTSMT